MLVIVKLDIYQFHVSTILVTQLCLDQNAIFDTLKTAAVFAHEFCLRRLNLLPTH